jgi:creatinine amidohydrolase/Fe(II)-dependent formamide hydrolase-like protein
MRSRFLLELTTPEVETYLAQGGKTTLLPVGRVEMHGPHQPIGTDSIIDRQVRTIAPILAHIDQYHLDTQEQSNKG